MILAIYGAGGFGRETLEIARQINAISHKWSELIFIDDFSDEKQKAGIRLLPFESFIKIYTPDQFEACIALGEPKYRAALWDRLKAKNCTIATIIHPNVHITATTSIGEGCVICGGAQVSCSTSIGDNTLVNIGAVVGHDVTVGKHCVISPLACIGGGCKIGDASFISMSVPIKEGMSIGSNSVVGIGSVVLRDIPDNVIAVGNPARAMSKNDGLVF